MNTDYASIQARVTQAFAKVDALGAEAQRIFITLDRKRALQDAEHIEQRLAQGETLPLAGVLCSIKDLVDRRGERTTAGSRLLAEAPPSDTDANIITRLEHAGAVIFGRTNLSEFAYSGVGMNPHHGTPHCIFDRDRVPGGSSSGAALSVAHGICDAAIGTDTGGSIRLPAAVNGLYGIKPTAHRVSTEGVHPLSTLMDSVGPLAADWCLAKRVFNTLLKEPFPPVSEPTGLRFGIPRGPMLDGLAPSVQRCYEDTLAVLQKAGLEGVEVDLAWMSELALANRSLIACEAHEQYGQHLEALKLIGDPHVLDRIRFAEEVDDAAQRRAHALREVARTRFRDALSSHNVNVILAPTLPIETPSFRDAVDDFVANNVAMLRNTSLINFVDGCAVSLPIGTRGPTPGALMVAAATDQDALMLAAVDALQTAMAAR